MVSGPVFARLERMAQRAKRAAHGKRRSSLSRNRRWLAWPAAMPAFRAAQTPRFGCTMSWRRESVTHDTSRAGELPSSITMISLKLACRRALRKARSVASGRLWAAMIRPSVGSSWRMAVNPFRTLEQGRKIPVSAGQRKGRAKARPRLRGGGGRAPARSAFHGIAERPQVVVLSRFRTVNHYLLHLERFSRSGCLPAHSRSRDRGRPGRR